MCRFPKLMSYSHLKCHPNVINDKKVGKTRLVDLRAMRAVEDPRVDGRRKDSSLIQTPCLARIDMES